MYQLILASESPRRKQLLQEAGFQFETLTVKVSEIPGKSLTVNQKILANAKEKSDAAWTRLKSQKQKPFLLLTADTEVILNNELLGKPKDRDHALFLLKELSGRIHEVKTGLWLRESQTEKEVSHIETTEVHFKKLSDETIENYVQSGEGRDKAGGYAIQGHGSRFIKEFVGSYDNVVGLPIQVLKRILSENSWSIQKEVGK